MHLACLSADTGELLWRLPLADPNVEIALDPSRQLLAAQTTIKGEMILTTTTTGWIFAVDAMTHAILWTRRLPLIDAETPRPRSFRNPAFQQNRLRASRKSLAITAADHHVALCSYHQH